MAHHVLAESVMTRVMQFPCDPGLTFTDRKDLKCPEEEMGTEEHMYISFALGPP